LLAEIDRRRPTDVTRRLYFYGRSDTAAHGRLVTAPLRTRMGETKRGDQ
jgi:hypothetical protein